MRVVVCKYGMKWYPRDMNNNAGGEQGETEGVLRHLVEAGHEVYYFGTHAGTIPGVTFCKPHIEDLDHLSTADHQESLWKKDVEMMGDYGIERAVQINGMAPTFSWIDNPKGALLQAFTVRFCGPWLNLLQKLKLNRLCVNNDPRSYPRDQEMSFGWDYVRPAAMLDQWDCRKEITVGGKRYLRESVYGACESFGYLEHRENLGQVPCIIVAHNHKWGKQTWPDAGRLLREFPGMEVWGNGWTGTAARGPAKPAQVFDLARSAKTMYIDPHTPGFRTGKPYVAVSQGCVPCYSYDEVMWALNNYDEAIAKARELYGAPKWDRFDQMLEENHAGGYQKIH